MAYGAHSRGGRGTSGAWHRCCCACLPNRMPAFLAALAVDRRPYADAGAHRPHFDQSQSPPVLAPLVFDIPAGGKDRNTARIISLNYSPTATVKSRWARREEPQFSHRPTAVQIARPVTVPIQAWSRPEVREQHMRQSPNPFVTMRGLSTRARARSAPSSCLLELFDVVFETLHLFLQEGGVGMRDPPASVRAFDISQE